MRTRPPKTFRTTLRDRARAMRHEPTAGEKLLWLRLRGDQLGGLRFRRQFRVNGFIVDFYCPTARTVIEVDGESHSGREDKDTARSLELNRVGLHVLRFTDEEVLRNIDVVVQHIFDVCHAKGPSPLPSPRVQGEGGSI